MPGEREYTYQFAEDVRLRARFMHERGRIVHFTVQLECIVDDEWRAVLRYDNAHGQPHMDILSRFGRQTRKHWLHQSNNEALTAAMTDIKANWPAYVERFKNGKL